VSATADLLFEIGCEEIPAGFLARALEALPQLARERLDAARLTYKEIVAIGAPRRLALAVTGLPVAQPDVSEEITGPPAKAAFDAAGKPTKAAIGFAQKNGVPIEALRVLELPGKGAYVAATRQLIGAPTATLLPKLLSELARAIPWKKQMRWASFDEAFVRPVHWIVALFGGEVVPLEQYGVKSGRETRGHRFLAPGAVALTGSLEDYKSKLRTAFVVVDGAARRTMIEAELVRVEKESGAKLRPDATLLDEVTNLVEYPQAVRGSFDEAFLEVPEEVIVSAIRTHLRYFALEGKDGKLVNQFVTIAGTVTKDPALVRAGNEKVIVARLSDARFFFREDQAFGLPRMAEKLAGVVFQKDLGTVGEKVVRIGKAATAAKLAGVPLASWERAVVLAKADLTSKMVGEFPDLQGVMGRHYARIAKEDAAVADAILEHYLPRGANDALPQGALGSALGIADRMDTIVGCFAVGLGPTGSADAFGLRRAALAVLNLLFARGWNAPLSTLVDDAATNLAGKIKWGAERRTEVLEFFRTRLRGLLVEQKGLAADCVDAALAAGFDDVPDAAARAAAVAHLRERPDFEPLGIAFKRVGNILKGEKPTGEPDRKRFAHASETALWDAFTATRGRVEDWVGKREYDRALNELATLKPAVDKFFDDVMVMDKDPAVKANRLALLGAVNGTFLRIADFRQLAVAQA
jgi:glycyl-tRNA synthetase beta chain